MTLLELKTQVRQRANMENSSFVSDTELTSLINNSYGELYDLLVSRFEDYFSKQSSFTLTSSNTQTLPTDFYKVRGLDFSLDATHFSTVPKWSFEDRNKVASSPARSITGPCGRTYRIMGQSLIILPSEQASGSYVLWYIPRFTQLVLDTDLCSDVLDFHEYIIVDSAMKCLTKEESDPSVLMAIKEGLKQRILALSSSRDTEPDVISDLVSSSWEF